MIRRRKRGSKRRGKRRKGRGKRGRRRGCRRRCSRRRIRVIQMGTYGIRRSRLIGKMREYVGGG